MTPSLLSRTVLLAALAAAPLAAQQPQLRPPSPPPPQPSSVALTLDLGFVNAAGNTRVTTLNAAEDIKLRPAGTRWQLEEAVSAVYGRIRDSVTAEQVKVVGRLDYRVLSIIHFFVGGTYERNRLAGIESRFEEVAGWALRPLDRPKDLLNIEFGSAVTQQGPTIGLNRHFVAGRMALNYKHQIATTAFVQQSVETLPDLNNWNDVRVNSETVLLAPISNKVALKLSYIVRFDNIPEPTFQKTDRLFSSGIQVVF